MTRLRTISIVSLAIIATQILAGCAAYTKYGELEANARQYYQQGDYDLAVFRCAESLRLNPNYNKAQVLIKDVFRAAVNTHNDNIKALKSSSAKFRWDDMVNEYEALIKLNQEIRSLPVLTDKETGEIIRFKITDFTQDITDAKTNAAEAHYQEGICISEKEGMDFKKQAAKEFKAALWFIPGYKDAPNMYEEYRKKATKRMVIIPFEDKSGKADKYGAISEMIIDGFIANITEDSTAMEFLELVTYKELKRVLMEQEIQMSDLADKQTMLEVGELLGVHEILVGKITQINYSRPDATIQQFKKGGRELVGKKKEYNVYEFVVPSDGTIGIMKVSTQYKEHNIYENFKAKVKIYTKTAEASIISSYKVIEVATNTLKKSDFLGGEVYFQYQWATYDGDARALSSEDEKLITKGRPLVPTEKELVLQAAQNLSILLAEELIDYNR